MKKTESRLNTSSSYPSTTMKFLEIIFVKYMYRDTYTSTHTNTFTRTFFKSGIYKVAWVVSAVSKPCSKFWKDRYDLKTNATWRFTQRSIYFKNWENRLFREIEVTQKTS